MTPSTAEPGRTQPRPTAAGPVRWRGRRPGAARTSPVRAARSPSALLPPRVAPPAGAGRAARRASARRAAARRAGHADRTPGAFFHRARRRRRLIGFGEAYMAGDWTLDRRWPPAHRVRGPALDTLVPPWLQRLGRCYAEAAPAASERNTVERSRGATSSRHYDLSNELFASFLDETMTLLVGAGSAPAASDDAAPTPSAARSTGCSTPPVSARHAACWRSAPAGARWRSGPRSAAPRSPRSPSRRSSAARRASGCAAAGVADRVEVAAARLPRGRGPYDAVVSVEMIEAVGERVLADLLHHPRPAARARRPGRAAGDHDAARPDARAARRTTRGSTSTSSPAGCIPSIEAIEETCARAHRRCGSPSSASLGAALRARRCAPGGERFLRALASRGRARVRRAPSAGCGSSTSPTARRVPHRLPRRRPARARLGRRTVSRTPGRRRGSPAVVERLARRDPCPSRIRAWDGTRGRRRPTRRPGRRAAAPAGAAAPAVEPRRARARPGVRHRRPRRRGRPRRRALPVLGVRADARAHRRSASAAGRPGSRALGGAVRLGVVGPPPRAARRRRRGYGRLHTRRRDRAVDRPPLRPVQRLLRAPARPADGLLLRLLDAGSRRRPTASPTPSATSSTSICRKLGLRPGHAAARRRLRLGVARSCTRRSTTACASPAVTLSRAAARRTGCARVAGARPGRPRRDPAAGLPRDRATSRSTRSRRSRWASTSASDKYPDVRRAAAPHAASRRAGSCCSRCRAARPGRNAPGGGPFIERYIAPDMHMRPLGATLGLLETAGSRGRATCRPCASTTSVTVRPWLDTLQERRARPSR